MVLTGSLTFKAILFSLLDAQLRVFRSLCVVKCLGPGRKREIGQR